MKAILLSSDKTGKGKHHKYHSYILNNLKHSYEHILDIKIQSIDDIYILIKKHHEAYDCVILCGGDGTFHHLINAVCQNNSNINVGYIPSGTLNDCGKTFGIKRNIKSSLKIIISNNVKKVDILKINDFYCFYMSAIGAYSSISYITQSKAKKSLSFFAYYFQAVKQLFIKNEVRYNIIYDDKKLVLSSPFLLILNGIYVGGFKINKDRLKEKNFTIFVPRSKYFNGLLNFLFNKDLLRLKLKECKIEVLNDSNWCVDGELRQSNVFDIKLLDKHVNFIVKK